jgi:hypothetical protein
MRETISSHRFIPKCLRVSRSTNNPIKRAVSVERRPQATVKAQNSPFELNDSREMKFARLPVSKERNSIRMRVC